MWSLAWSCRPGDSLGEVIVTATAEGLTIVESRARSTLFRKGFVEGRRDCAFVLEHNAEPFTTVFLLSPSFQMPSCQNLDFTTVV